MNILTTTRTLTTKLNSLPCAEYQLFGHEGYEVARATNHNMAISIVEFDMATALNFLGFAFDNGRTDLIFATGSVTTYWISELVDGEWIPQRFYFAEQQWVAESDFRYITQ